MPESVPVFFIPITRATTTPITTAISATMAMMAPTPMPEISPVPGSNVSTPWSDTLMLFTSGSATPFLIACWNESKASSIIACNSERKKTASARSSVSMLTCATRVYEFSPVSRTDVDGECSRTAHSRFASTSTFLNAASICATALLMRTCTSSIPCACAWVSLCCSTSTRTRHWYDGRRGGCMEFCSTPVISALSCRSGVSAAAVKSAACRSPLLPSSALRLSPESSAPLVVLG